MASITFSIKLLLVALMMLRAFKHHSLTPAGILAAGVTGLVHSLGDDWLDLGLLIGFFITGTQFTKLKADVKKSLTVVVSESGTEGPRNWIQVLANSCIASVLILLSLFTQIDVKLLRVGVISQYAAVTADTWSSELGILSSSAPFLITTFKTCPKGTNGGVSLLGLAMASAGGGFIGLISLIFSSSIALGGSSLISKWFFIVLLSLLGLYGSVLDSILGALFQRSVVNESGVIVEASGGIKLDRLPPGSKVISGSASILSNNQVNLLMALITTGTGMFIAWCFG